MASEIGDDFYEPISTPLMTKPLHRDAFLKKMGVELLDLISPREFEIIKHLLQGLTASQIAQVVFLSKRAVEHHLERIKDKLSCFSKSELISKIRELESIGYLKF